MRIRVHRLCGALPRSFNSPQPIEVEVASSRFSPQCVEPLAVGQQKRFLLDPRLDQVGIRRRESGLSPTRI
jgi:hypothetical protein